MPAPGTPAAARHDAAEPLVQLEGLGKRFAARQSWTETLRRPLRRQYTDALDSVSFDVRRGEFFGLLGPNGAGKTSLFKILATLLLPDRGSARVCGRDVVAEARAVRQLLTPVVADERSLNWRLSARENLRLFAGLYGLRPTVGEHRARAVLRQVGLADAGEKLVGSFSSGMKQRLLVGRALLARPRVLLLDEPTRSLDPLSARDFRRLLREQLVGEQGCTVLLATHNTEEALELCDRVGILHRGRLLAVGTVEALSKRLADERYVLLAREPVRHHLAALQRRGRIAAFEAPEHDGDDGWLRVELEIPGEREAVAAILSELVGAGVAVASFHRKPLTLVELLERVMTRGADV